MVKKKVGTGGNNKRRLAGKGPTPKAEDRTYHPAANRKKAAAKKTAAKKPAAKKAVVKKAAKKPAAKKASKAPAAPAAQTTLNPQAAWPFPSAAKP